MRHYPVLSRALLLAFWWAMIPFSVGAATPLTVEHPTALILSGIPNGAGYLTLTNPTAAEHAIIGASSECCDVVELHTHIHDGGAMRMRKMERLLIPAHGTLPFSKGGHHLMLIGLKQAYRAGDRIPITLQFDQKDSLTVPFVVQTHP